MSLPTKKCAVELVLDVNSPAKVREHGILHRPESPEALKTHPFVRGSQNSERRGLGRAFSCSQILADAYCWDDPPGVVSCCVPSSWGDDMTAVSGFSKPFLSGPSPSLINARESGVTLVCQPFSAW